MSATRKNATRRAARAAAAEQHVSEVVDEDTRMRTQAAADALMANADCIGVICKHVMRLRHLPTYASFRLAASALLDIWRHVFEEATPSLRPWPMNMELGLAQMHSQDVLRTSNLDSRRWQQTRRAEVEEERTQLMEERACLEEVTSSRMTRSAADTARQLKDNNRYIDYNRREMQRLEEWEQHTLPRREEEVAAPPLGSKRVAQTMRRCTLPAEGQVEQPSTLPWIITSASATFGFTYCLPELASIHMWTPRRSSSLARCSSARTTAGLVTR